MALMFIVLVLSRRLADPWWLVSFAAVIPLAVVQRTVNALNAKVRPDADRNRRLSKWNWIAAILGTLLLALKVYDTLFPAAP